MHVQLVNVETLRGLAAQASLGIYTQFRVRLVAEVEGLSLLCVLFILFPEGNQHSGQVVDGAIFLALVFRHDLLKELRRKHLTSAVLLRVPVVAFLQGLDGNSLDGAWGLQVKMVFALFCLPT